MKLSAPLAALLGLLASVTPESLAAPQQQQHVLKRTGEELPARTVNDLSDPFADQFQDLIRRQGQGIGGVGGSEVSGLPTIKHVPFDGNDSLPYSPPFYPSPKTPGKGAWTEAVRKAKDYLEQFTVEEKVSLTTGVGWTRGRCVGNIGAIERIGFPGLCLEDGPLGVRFADLVSVFPAGITTAATFSKELMYERGVAMGEEHRGKGVNIQLGPDVNIVRAPAGGRNWETFGADPYLSGWAAHETVRGIQDAGVQADAKHYINNEQEHFRNEGSSNVDDRTEHEIYLHPFLRSIQANVATFMCSYNLINNSHSCQNSDLLNGRLKTEMGFQGLVMSDWGAQHSGVASANAGLDMSMPGDVFCCYRQNGSYWGRNLTQAVNNGSVAMSRLDDMATRILAAWYLVGQDDPNYPKVNFDYNDVLDPATNEHVDVTGDHYKVIREIGAAGTVLLKNKHNALPLRKPKKIALIGSDAGPLYQGPNFYGDRGGDAGTLGEGWGSGSVDYSYFISPYEAIQARARKDRTGVNWNFDDYNYEQSMKVANYTDAAIVFINAMSGEGYITVDKNEGDRNNLTAWHNGNDLIGNVTSVNNNTIVVVHSVSALTVEPWIDNPNVTAVLWASLPGCESGNSITEVLYGDYNPSGRLPYTIAKQRSDYSAEVLYTNTSVTPQVNYTEGLLVDYRAFDARDIKPRFEFGFGLSYSKFEYSYPRVHWIGDASQERHEGKGDWNHRWGHKQAPEGLPEWLFEPVYEVSFVLKNIGGVDGHEVPQLYLGFDNSTGEPPKVLREFDRVYLAAEEQKKITWNLSSYDLSIWNTTQQRWVRPHGRIELYIGASSRDIRQTLHV